LLRQHVVERTRHFSQIRCREIALVPLWGEACGQQQCIVLPERNVERRGQAVDHLAAWRSAPKLEKAQALVPVFW
jgi:hypothetical protein